MSWAKGSFGYQEPPVPVAERRMWRNHYARAAARKITDGRAARRREFLRKLEGAMA